MLMHNYLTAKKIEGAALELIISSSLDVESGWKSFFNILLSHISLELHISRLPSQCPIPGKND